MSIDTATVKEVLEQRLAKLTRRVDAIEKHLRRQMEADLPEQAQRSENDEVLEGLDASGLEEIAQIRAAIAKIDEGIYEECSRCEAPIGDGRLKALPYATQCVRCAGLAS